MSYRAVRLYKNNEGGPEDRPKGTVLGFSGSVGVGEAEAVRAQLAEAYPDHKISELFFKPLFRLPKESDPVDERVPEASMSSAHFEVVPPLEVDDAFARGIRAVCAKEIDTGANAGYVFDNRDVTLEDLEHRERVLRERFQAVHEQEQELVAAGRDAREASYEAWHMFGGHVAMMSDVKDGVLLGQF